MALENDEKMEKKKKNLDEDKLLIEEVKKIKYSFINLCK